MSLIDTAVNVTTIITTSVTNNIDANGVLEPVVKGLVIPILEKFTPRVITWGTYASTGRRTGRAVLEYYEGKCSLRNPRVWIRGAAAVCTGGSALLQTYGGVANLTGCRAEWAGGVGMSLEALAQTLEKKLDILAVGF